MSSIKHILVPTDGSVHACKAAAIAADMARGLGARVSLLYVMRDDLIMPEAWGVGLDPDGPTLQPKSAEEIRSILEQRARDNELAMTRKAMGELEAEPEAHFAWGHAGDEISRYASDNDVDLIVIGSHGRGGIKRAFLGSVSQAVAHQAGCAVTIVK